MAALSHSDSKRKYSWWWDSHISPKNSKWLQENLTDMDTKVKQMIKLIEEDADSFARRAEMYYKKRPELMKLVEEFYRAYRALAERYDHATVVIHHAHRTMAEAFPNQDPPVFSDDIQAGSFSSESAPRTPDMPPPPRAFLDPDELHKDIIGLPPSNFLTVKGNGVSNEGSNSWSGRRGANDILKPGEPESHAKFRQRGARKELNFQDLAEKENIVQKSGNQDDKPVVLSETERVTKAETEILALKEALAKLQAEKEAGLNHHQHSLERLSKLESQFFHAQENSQGLNECASKAEAEVQTLKEALTKLEGERESSLLQYKLWMEKVFDLERKMLSSQKDAGELNVRNTRAESKAEYLKHEFSRTKTEKEAALLQYKECQDKVSDLEEKLLKSEEDCRRLCDRANEAEREIVLMKEEISKLFEQKEVAALQYQHCLENISSLEHKLSCAEEEARMLMCKVDSGLKKLKGSEERCLVLDKSNKDLQSELESLVQKVGFQNEELTEKQKELGRLWTCIQEERLRFVEAETAFQTLQSIYSQSQEELRALAMELHNKAKFLDDLNTQNQILKDEVHRCKEENDILNDVKLSSALSIKKLEDQILNLRETIRKLEEDVEFRVDQRNALQQEIYCLKEELNNLNKKHRDMLQLVESVGFDPNSFGSSVKELQNNNSNLKKRCEAQEVEKAALLEKLEIMQKLLEKNAVLENSLSNLNIELETVRGRVKMLEESYQSLMEEKCSLTAEKATLTSQLQVTLENLEKLSQKNNLLENSLFDVNVELHGLREKSKSLEDSLFVLNKEKSSLISEKQTLFSQLSLTHQTLENLVKRCSELEEKYQTTKSEKESALQKIEQLLVSLYAEREEHSKFLQSSEIQLADKDLQIHLLQEDGKCREEEYEEQLDRAVNAEMEIFILQKCVQDLEDKSMSLLIEHHKLLEAVDMSEKLVSKLENESIQNQDEIQSLYEKIKILRMGLYQVLKTLDIKKELLLENVITEDHMLLHHIHHQLQETQNSLVMLCHENQQLNIEKSVLITALEQLKLKIDDLLIERNTIEVNFGTQTRQLLALQEESQTVLQKNEELRSRIEESDKRVQMLETKLDDKLRQLSIFEVANKSLQEESHKACEENTFFRSKVLRLGEEKRKLESEVFSILGEMISETTISQLYKSILFEYISVTRELTENMEKISSTNKEFEENLKIMAEKFEDVQMLNSNLQESLEKSHIELRSVESANYHLKSEKEKEKEVVLQKEYELLQAKEMFIVLQNEKTDLQDLVEGLKMKYHEARVILEDQENRIAHLSSDKEYLNGELGSIFEVSQKLKSEMMDLCGELSKSKSREGLLSYELQKEKTEVDLWETQAAEFYGDLQISAVKELLFDGKIQELVEECEILEDKSYAQNSEVKLLKDRVSCLEIDNGRLHGHLAAYIPAVASLRDAITSLEKQTLYQTEQHNVDDRQTKAIENQLHADSCQQKDVDQLAIVADPLSECQILQKRINAIGKAVVRLKAISVPNHINDDVEVGGTREIRELKIRTSSSRENNEAREPRDGRTIGNQRLKSSPKNSKLEAEVLTKDIILDQMSECSSYGISRREIMVSDDRMTELWETTDQDESIDLTVGNVPKTGSKPVNHLQKHNKNPSVESLVKELSVDKLEISKKIGEPRERKILERLDSDVQKLTNLQITVEDLKKKIEMSAKAKKGTDIQYETLMEQLKIAEAAIKKLSGTNSKLMKHAEDGSLSIDGDTTAGSDDSGSISKRSRLAAQARRASEKIGRLQVEVKRIQFVLLKLDGEKESKGKTKVLERSPRVLLRDYLYGAGGARTKQQRRRRAKFCACVQPSTKSD